jgi:hypothetical protein
MRNSLALAALIAASALPSAPALAAPAPGASGDQHITVDGNRRVCRSVRRTATRMSSGSHICRTVNEWAQNGVRGVSAHHDIDDAQNALDMFGEKVSTNDVGGIGGSGSISTGGAGPY